MQLKQALLHNTGWKIITMLFTFLSNILIVRILGVVDSGQFFYAIAIFTLLSTIFRFGVENGLVYYLSKYPDKSKSAVTFLFSLLLIQIPFIYLILKYQVKETAVFLIAVVVLFVLVNIYISYLSAFYQAKKMFFSLNVSGCIVAFLQVLVLFFIYCNNYKLIHFFGIEINSLNFLLLILMSAFSIHFLFLFLYYFSTNKLIDKQLVNTNTAKQILNFSLFNFGITVLYFLVLRADLYFVEKYCTKIELGNYVQAAKIGQLLLVFPGLIGGVIFPYTINASDAIPSKVAFLCRAITVVYLAVFFGILILGKWFFVWLLGADFNLMYSIFLYLFPGVFFLSISLILISYFEGVNKQKIILYAFTAVLLIVIMGNYFITSNWGYKFAALIFSFSNLIGLIILFIHFKRGTKLYFKDIFILNRSDWQYLFKRKNG